MGLSDNKLDKREEDFLTAIFVIIMTIVSCANTAHIKKQEEAEPKTERKAVVTHHPTTIKVPQFHYILTR